MLLFSLKNFGGGSGVASGATGGGGETTDGCGETGGGGANPVVVYGEYNQFDINQISALESMYQYQGRSVTYNGDAIRVIMVDHSKMTKQDDNTKRVEHLTVLMRRYNGDCESPELNDALMLEGDAGVDEKTFRLSAMDEDAFTQLEFELTFSRTVTIRRGGAGVRPLGVR